MITLSMLHFWLILFFGGFITAAFALFFVRTKKRILAFEREIKRLKHDMGIKSVDLLSQIEKLTEENQALLSVKKQ